MLMPEALPISSFMPSTNTPPALLAKAAIASSHYWVTSTERATDGLSGHLGRSKDMEQSKALSDTTAILDFEGGCGFP